LTSWSESKIKITKKCTFWLWTSSEVNYINRQISFRSLLKIFSSSLISCMSFAVLKIAVKMLYITTLYHFSFFLIFINSKICCQIFWCFRRSSVIISDIIIMIMLNFDWDIVMMTIMMLRVADLKTLLMLFLIEIKSNVLTTVINVIIRHLFLYDKMFCNVVVIFDLIFWTVIYIKVFRLFLSAVT